MAKRRMVSKKKLKKARKAGTFLRALKIGSKFFDVFYNVKYCLLEGGFGVLTILPKKQIHISDFDTELVIHEVLHLYVGLHRLDISHDDIHRLAELLDTFFHDNDVDLSPLLEKPRQ